MDFKVYEIVYIYYVVLYDMLEDEGGKNSTIWARDFRDCQ
jgi:hypothetical protein